MFSRSDISGVLMSGVFASLAGAFLSVGELGRSVENMIHGRGFIALAAMILVTGIPLSLYAILWRCGSNESSATEQLYSLCFVQRKTSFQYASVCGYADSSRRIHREDTVSCSFRHTFEKDS